MKFVHDDCPFCRCLVAEAGGLMTILVDGTPVARDIPVGTGNTISFRIISLASSEKPPS